MAEPNLEDLVDLEHFQESLAHVNPAQVRNVVLALRQHHTYMYDGQAMSFYDRNIEAVRPDYTSMYGLFERGKKMMKQMSSRDKIAYFVQRKKQETIKLPDGFGPFSLFLLDQYLAQRFPDTHHSITPCLYKKVPSLRPYIPEELVRNCA